MGQDVQSPAQIFDRYGLKTRRAWQAPEPLPAHAGLPLFARFRNALEELGGLYAEYARFLGWRADLQRPDAHQRFRNSRAPAPPAPDPPRIAGVALHGDPVWSTPSRCAWKGEYQGRAVVAQVARAAPAARVYERLYEGLQAIEEPAIAPLITDAVIDEFRQWARLADSLDRERGYLEALATVGSGLLAEYPALIPEISGEHALCFEWIEGEPLAACLARGDRNAVARAAEYVLEQITTVLAIDGDFDPDAMVITPGGRLAVRSVPRMVAIAPSLAGAALKYASAVLSQNAPAAAHLLVKLATGRTDLNLETKLLNELSNLEPELKVNLQFPASAAVFESNWRALSRAIKDRPLYLNLMHRNLLAVGYWNAESGGAEDLLIEAQWPVLSKLLRTRFGDLMTRETISDWAIGSGLIAFETVRQAGRVAEQLRDNEISVGVELQREDEGRHQANRSIRRGVFVGMLVMTFLVSLRLAWALDGPWSAILSAVAAGTGIALFWFVSRLD